jgi:hypothetical protein
MTELELKEKIKTLVKVIKGEKKKVNLISQDYDELTKFPELKKVIVDLLTSDFDNFLSSIDWVAPKPTTFRINLKNDQSFYVEWNGRSWIAVVFGKRYYMLNLAEEQHAIEAVSRLLKFGPKESKEPSSMDLPIEEPPADEISPEKTPEEPPTEA